MRLPARLTAVLDAWAATGEHVDALLVRRRRGRGRLSRRVRTRVLRLGDAGELTSFGLEV
jgi:hypothetical protein